MYPRGPPPSVKETTRGVGQGENKCRTRGQNGTHRKRGDVKTVPTVIFHHLNDAIVVRYVERWVLPRRIEIPSVCNWSSSDITARQRRGNARPFLDDPQSGGGPDRCVVCFYDPGFVHLDANCGIVTDPGSHPIGVWHRFIRVYLEVARRRETGVESDEDRLDSHPSSIANRTFAVDCAGVEAVGHAVVPPFHCGAQVRSEECERVD